MKELWLPVPGWEKFYRVSNFGDAESLGRMTARKSPSGVPYQRWIDGKRLKPSLNDVGYLHIQMTAEGRRTSAAVAPLVMATFVGPKPKGLQVAHLDGNRTNNRLDNLEYKTPKENAMDRIRHGTSGKGEKNSMSKLSDLEREEIRHRYRFEAVSAMELAEIYGVVFQTIYKIVNE